KVKEPQPGEVALLRPEHMLFTYLHLAPDPELAHGLCRSGATCIAYETVEDEHGRLPLLAPMSEVAGRIASQVGAAALVPPGRRAWCGASTSPACAPERSSSTSRSTRAAASRRRARPRTPSPPTRSTAWSTTASPTCPARCRSPRRRR